LGGFCEPKEITSTGGSFVSPINISSKILEIGKKLLLFIYKYASLPPELKLNTNRTYYIHNISISYKCIFKKQAWYNFFSLFVE